MLVKDPNVIRLGRNNPTITRWMCDTKSDDEISTVQLNSLSANPTKWSNTLKQFVDNLPTNCLNVFDNFVGLTLKGLIECHEI